MLFLALLLILAVSDAAVDFSYSTIYDLSDFVSKNEIRIPQCGKGCLIFASTLGGFLDKPDQVDPYARNIYIVDNDRGQRYSFTSIAGKFDRGNRKVPLDILGGMKYGPASNVSLINLNDEGSQSYPVVLYVIDRDKANTFTYYIYDAINALDGVNAPYYSIATIMSAQPFSVKAHRMEGVPMDGGFNGQVAVTLAGFENAMPDNVNGCSKVAYMPIAFENHPTLFTQYAPPIVSFAMGSNNYIIFDVELDTSLASTRNLSLYGFIASYGFNGCTLLSGGHQNYQSPYYNDSVTYVLSADSDYYNVSADIVPYIDGNNYFRITDYESDGSANENFIRGKDEKKMIFPTTNRIVVDYNDLKGGQGFIITYQPKLVVQTTPRPTTEGTTITTSASGRIGVILLLLVTIIFS